MSLGNDNSARDNEWIHMAECGSINDMCVPTGTISLCGAQCDWRRAFDGLHSVTGFNECSSAKESQTENFAEDAFINIWLFWLVDMHCTDCVGTFDQCPRFLTYDETAGEAIHTMMYDDYTTRVDEPLGYGGTYYRLMIEWSDCNHGC